MALCLIRRTVHAQITHSQRTGRAGSSTVLGLLFGGKHPSLQAVRTPFVVYAVANNLCSDDVAVGCVAFYLLAIGRSSIPDKRRPEPVPVEPRDARLPAAFH